MTNEVNETLTATKALLKADPVMNQEFRGVWTYPLEYNLINASQNQFLPVALITYEVNIEGEWRVKAGSQGFHKWMLQFLILIKKGFIRNQAEIWQEEADQMQLITKISDFLAGHGTLGGTVQQIGEAGVLMNYRIGNLYWDNEEFWGIVINAPVLQTRSQLMVP